jgi:hypothetical protein
LLGDPTAVFGVTATGTIWTLDATETSVRQLVAGETGDRSISATLASTSLFWTDAGSGALHRTARDGSGDVTLVSGLTSPGLVTADDTRVYWFEPSPDSPFGDGGGMLRSLPLDAAPGEMPAGLAAIGETSSVSSMVASGGSLYWTPYGLGSTMYYASLVTAPVATLLAGGTATVVPEIAQPYALVASGGAIYFAYNRNLWTTVVANLNYPEAVLSILPIDVDVTGLLITGDWLLATGQGVGQEDLYATPLDSPAGFVIVATDLLTPAVLGPAGVTYVDSSDTLVAFPVGQLGYVGFGHPAP